MTSPEAVFAELRAQTPRQPGRAYRLFDGPGSLAIRTFVDGSSRLPGFSLTVAKHDVPEEIDLPRVRGARLNISQSTGANAISLVTYELAASDETYSTVFIELASRLIHDVRLSPDARIALSVLARRLAAWARFFDERGSEGLSRHAQLGLIGELLCMRKLFTLIGANAAVASWTGPSRAVHDFQGAWGAIEAKLSTSSAPERLRITSERQLDDSSVPWLGLFAVLAQESASGEIGLGSLVDTIREELGPVAPLAVSEFEERLIESGFIDSDRELYTVRVAVRSAEFLTVAGAFPRIRPVHVPAGVFRVAYDIAWSAIAPFRVSEDDVRRQIGRAEQ